MASRILEHELPPTPRRDEKAATSTFGGSRKTTISSATVTVAVAHQPHHQPHLQQPHSISYYSLCFVGGVLSSSIRWIKTPLDNVKCNMQVSPTTYPSFRSGLAFIYQREGLSGLYRGLLPTMLAYGTQTGIKYGMYEVLKDYGMSQYHHHRPSSHVDDNHNNYTQGWIYICAAATAEIIADVFMCPWELLKVKVQTDTNFYNRHYSNNNSSLLSALQAMKRADTSFPFGAGLLGPLWARQVPTTIFNFYTFENTAHFLYQDILHCPNGKKDCSTATQLGVTLVAGYTAGIVSTMASHIPDSLVSLKTTRRFKDRSLLQIMQEVGLWKLATNGLGPRVAMTGTIIAFQWFFYNSFKSFLGMGTTGG